MPTASGPGLARTSESLSPWVVDSQQAGQSPGQGVPISMLWAGAHSDRPLRSQRFGRFGSSRDPRSARHPAPMGPPTAALPALRPGAPPTLPVAQGCARGPRLISVWLGCPAPPGAGPGIRPASSFTFIFAFPVMTEEPGKAVPSRFWHCLCLSTCCTGPSQAPASPGACGQGGCRRARPRDGCPRRLQAAG